MILQQGQVWRQGDQYIRVVRLERLKVEYKAMKDLTSKEGTHHHVSKKEFCRLIRGATLTPVAPASRVQAAAEAADGQPAAVPAGADSAPACGEAEKEKRPQTTEAAHVSVPGPDEEPAPPAD